MRFEFAENARYMLFQSSVYLNYRKILKGQKWENIDRIMSLTA